MGHSMDYSDPIKATTDEEQGFKNYMDNQLVKMHSKLKEQNVQSSEATDDTTTEPQNYTFSNALYSKLKKKDDQDETGKWKMMRFFSNTLFTS